MGFLEMIVLVTLIGTVGKVLQAAVSRPGRGLPAAAEERIRTLEAELRASELRLADAEEHVALLAEKLGFVEELLAEPPHAPRIPAPDSPPRC